MGLFSRKSPTTWIGRYITHVGAFGLIALLIGVVSTFLFLGNIINLVTLKPIQAEVVEIREECDLVWQQEGKRKSQSVSSCEKAEKIKATSTERLYRIDRDPFVTVKWIGTDGRAHQRELDKITSKSLKRLEPGERGTVLVGSGENPRVGSHETPKSLGISAAIIAFCAWMAWPPAKPGTERTPFIYIRNREGRGIAGKSVSWLKNFIARWSATGAICGLVLFIVGAWQSLYPHGDQIQYLNVEAQITSIEESCRLSPRNGKILKIDSLLKVPCDQAYAIAENRPEENYDVKERIAYQLSYVHPTGGELEQTVSWKLLGERGVVVNDAVKIKVAADNPKRIRIIKAESEKVESKGGLWSMRVVHLMMMGGALLMLIGGGLAWLLGVGINWSRISWLWGQTSRTA